MTVGEKIKQLRKDNKITQTELGKILNVEKSTISMYENNNTQPPIQTLSTIAKYFNVTTDYLLGNETKNKEQNSQDKDEKDIAKSMKKLKEQLKDEQGLMFDGEPLDDTTIELLLEELERQERLVKKINKKYTPKKYLK